MQHDTGWIEDEGVFHRADICERNADGIAATPDKQSVPVVKDFVSQRQDKLADVGDTACGDQEKGEEPNQ